MNVELTPKAEKYFRQMNQPDKGRIVKALEKLCAGPPQGDIRPLVSRDSYRLRVGSYRILFKVKEHSIAVHAITPRGQAYKGGF